MNTKCCEANDYEYQEELLWACTSPKCISKSCWTFCISHAEYKTVNYHIQCNPKACQFILQKDTPSPNLPFQSKTLGQLNLSKSPLIGFHMFMKESESESRSVISDSLQPHRLYNPWNSPGQFSRSVVSGSLWPHGLHHARLPCPSPTLRAYSNSCPLSQWCHPTISSSVVPFSFHLQYFPASGSFPMSQLFASGGQSIGASASASVLPMNIQNWFPLGWTGWISLQSNGCSRIFSNTTAQKHLFFSTQLSL